VIAAVTGPDATQTEALAVVLALALVAVRVNVVATVTLGVTVPVVSGVTEPTALSMESAVAPLTFHARVTVPPSIGTLLGVAVKLVMVGAGTTLLAKAIPNVNTPPAATVSDGVEPGKERTSFDAVARYWSGVLAPFSTTSTYVASGALVPTAPRFKVNAGTVSRVKPKAAVMVISKM